METLFTILIIISTPFIILLIASLYVILQIFTGKSIKDPTYPPINGTVFHQLLYFTRLYDYQTQVARKIPTYRLLGPHQSDIYTTNPQNIEHVLKTKFDKYAKGTGNQELVEDLFGRGIFAVDGEQWKQQRKLASFEFSTRVLRDFSCVVFRRNASKLVRLLSELADVGRVFDMQDMMMRCTLDSIFKVGFGVELNCLNNSSSPSSSEERSDFMKAFDDANEMVYWRYVDPFWKLKRLLNVGSEASLKKSIRIIDEFVHKLVISSKKELLPLQRKDKEDILSRFLVESEKNPATMNEKYLRDIILNFMIAGKDTTANTLSWFIYLLCKNPTIQEKIVQEIKGKMLFGLQEKLNNNDDEAHENNIVDNFVADITDATLDKMHYLHAALTETLRLYPAVPTDGRVAQVDDVLPDGLKVKKGDGVYYISYAMGRMPYIWGEDAEEFRPERWLDPNGVFQPQSPFKFISFHAGPRICLGKDFAYRQMKIFAIAMLHFFRFRLADDTRNVTYKTMFTLHIAGGLPVRAIRRTLQ